MTNSERTPLLIQSTALHRRRSSSSATEHNLAKSFPRVSYFNGGVGLGGRSSSISAARGSHGLSGYEGGVYEDSAKRPGFLGDDAVDELLDEERVLMQSTSPARASAVGGAAPDEDEIHTEFTQAVHDGLVRSSREHEVWVITKYSMPLVITFCIYHMLYFLKNHSNMLVLQYSLQVASVISLGHLGTDKLAGSSIGSMTCSITGTALILGITTALDTLGAQAWGAGKPGLVGLHLQRTLLLLLLLHIPMGLVWIFASEYVLREWLRQDPEIAHLAATYLKVILIGMPAYSIFESLKRFLQVQCIFYAGTIILFFVAPINMVLTYVLVYHTPLGYIGAPLSVAISFWLMALAILMFIMFIDGGQAWDGFSWDAFRNWGPLLTYGTAGSVAICSEWSAFEIVALAASFIGTNELAANSILTTTCGMTYQIPFAISVATSTRIGNLVGATLSDAAKTASQVGLLYGMAIGLLNAVILIAARNYIGYVFDNDDAVAQVVANTIPLCALFQFFDALGCVANGCLRGQGRQHVRLCHINNSNLR